LSASAVAARRKPFEAAAAPSRKANGEKRKRLRKSRRQKYSNPNALRNCSTMGI
jgi:hypothetical protein